MELPPQFVCANPPQQPLKIPAITIRKSSSSESFGARREARPRMLPEINTPIVDEGFQLRRRSTQNILPAVTNPLRRVSGSEISSSSTDSLTTMNEAESNESLTQSTGFGSKWLHVLFNGRTANESRKVCRVGRRASSTSTLRLTNEHGGELFAEERRPLSTDDKNGTDTMQNSMTTNIKSNSELYCYNNSVSTFFETDEDERHSNNLLDQQPPSIAASSTSSSSSEELQSESVAFVPQVTETYVASSNFYQQLFRKNSTVLAAKCQTSAYGKLPKAIKGSNDRRTPTASNTLFDPVFTPIGFLTRTDFFHLLKSHVEPRTLYMQNQQLKNMVNRIRRDPSYFLIHCIGNRDMTSFLNVFVAAAVKHINESTTTSDSSLPDGWRMKRHFDGRIMYCAGNGHLARERTTFTDPRLAALTNLTDDDPNTFASSGSTNTHQLSRHEFLSRTRHARRLRRRQFSSSSSSAKNFLSSTVRMSNRTEPIEWLSPSEQQRIEAALLEAAASTEAAEPQSLAINSTSFSSAYEARLIGFIRQPHAMSIMARRHPDLLSDLTLQQYIRRVKRDGRPALRHLSYSIRFAMLVSACAHDIEQFHQTTPAPSGPLVLSHFNGTLQQPPSHLPPNEFSILCRMLTTANQHRQHRRHSSHAHHRRHHSSSPTEEKERKAKNKDLFPLVGAKPPTFAEKVKLFHRHLRRKSRGHSSLQKVKLTIKRGTCLQDAFDKIMRLSRRELAHGCLYVRFEDEVGLDYGGPLREFFALLSSEVFDPYYGLFEYGVGENCYAVQINQHSDFVDDSLKWFRFAGRVLSLALLHGCLVDVRFTPLFYQALLSQTEENNSNKTLSYKLAPTTYYELAHLSSIDPDLHRSLSWLAQNPIPDAMRGELFFSINQNNCGVVKEVDLRPHGRYQSVTDENKAEYIQLVVQWHCEQRSVAKQMQAIGNGFRELLGYEGYSLLSTLFAHPDELQMLLAGLSADRAIDIEDWRANTDYKSGYDNNSVTVKMFWNVVGRCFTEAQRLQLLVFVTGTASLPYDGFGSLRGSSGGLKKFTIEKWDSGSGANNNSKLPRAHTCFNRLDLPPYSDEMIMYKKLLMAIEETEAFGIE